MDITKKLEPYFPKIEKVIISLIFVSVLLSYLVGEAGNVFSILIILLQVGLIACYFIQLQFRMYALIWAGFLLQVAAYFFSNDIPYLLFIFFNIVSYVAFGVIVLVKTIGLSIKTKNFELLNFIMGFLLVLQLGLLFGLDVKPEIITFYTFALSFSMGTIIYNDNLWNRYHNEEKNIIKYILIVALVMVLQSSFKYFNI